MGSRRAGNPELRFRSPAPEIVVGDTLLTGIEKTLEKPALLVDLAEEPGKSGDREIPAKGSRIRRPSQTQTGGWVFSGFSQFTRKARKYIMGCTQAKEAVGATLPTKAPEPAVSTTTDPGPSEASSRDYGARTREVSSRNASPSLHSSARQTEIRTTSPPQQADKHDDKGKKERESRPPSTNYNKLDAPGRENGRPMSGASTSGSMPSSPTSAIDPGMFITQQKAHLSDRYIRERKLGSGAYGEVLLCRDKQSGAERAVKIIKKSSVSPNAGNNLLEEVAVVKQLDHPNIMKLYEFFEDKRNYYLVMEVYKGGELFDEIIDRRRFSEADAAHIMKQVLSGVTYLHKHRIVHRDLKPENLLLESKAKDALIKIVDFGLSAYFDPTKKLKDRLGTAYYIAPEVLRKKYDEKCDVWACGVILYILLCGYPPFGGASDQEILRRVEKGKYVFEPPEWTKVSEDVKDLIRQMLTYDPARRIAAEEALQHRWIQKLSEKKEGKVEAPMLLNALGNMRKFQASQKLAQAALLFMGSKLTTLEETKELTQIFRKLDANGDGQLDRKELILGYEELLKMKGEDGGRLYGAMTRQQIEEEVDKVLDSVDFDKNGYIEYSEFVTVAMDKKVLLSKERLQAAFQMFDQDGSGKIAAEELRRIMDVDEDQWSHIIREVDANNDGEVDFEEFVAMMQKLCLDS